MRFILVCLLLAVVSPLTTLAQQQQSNERKGEFYFSWGYNTEWYTKSNVYVSQPALGNDYTFEDIKGHDKRGWDEGFFTKQLTIPQYNYRLGYFIDKKKDIAFEINFDHTKFIFSENQAAHVKGTLNNRSVDTTIIFASPAFYYFLNNGANFLLFNIVKRYHIVKSKNSKESFKLDFLGKAGVGPVIPHVENSFFGYANSPHFQLGGWNVGVEGALRATFFKYGYIEYTNKVDYARYSGLRTYEGTTKQAFGTYEMILNFGVSFPVGKRTEDKKDS